MSKTYLVTGGAGFIGSNLIESLLESSNKVINVDNLIGGNSKNIINHPSVKNIKSSIQDIGELSIFKDISGIFHLAAQSSVPLSIKDPYNSSGNNLLASLKVMDIARVYKLPIVYASSSAIYGNLPMGDESSLETDILSPYALDKLVMEKYSSIYYKLFKVSFIGLRFFNVYGPKQDPSNPYSGVISIFIDRILKNKTITVNGGYQTRDFIYVDDVIKILRKSMDKAKKNKMNHTLNVGTGKSISIDELLAFLIEIIGVYPAVKYVPLDDGDPEKSDGNYNKLKKLLDINLADMITINEGLKKTVTYEKSIKK